MRRREPMFRRAITAVALAAAGVLMMVPLAQAAVASSTVVSDAQLTTNAGVSPPSLSSFSPNKGPMGIKVTITGSGFTGTTKVTFHGTVASFKVVSNTRITATVPCGATTGRVRVSTPKGTATSAAGFKIT